MKDSVFYKAVSRIIYDIVGADGIFSDRELSLVYQTFNEKYSLESFSFEQICDLSLSDALCILQKEDYKPHLNELFKDICFLSGIDWQYATNVERERDYSKGIEGHCSSEEALILIACSYALNKNAITFSSNNDKHRFAKNEIIFVENYHDEEINNEIKSKYDYITTKLEIYGLRFVYIPHVCTLLHEKSKTGDFLKIVRYINEQHKCTDTDIQNIVSDGLPNITTKQFTEDFLSGQTNWGKDYIYNEMVPSLMLKFSTSSLRVDFNYIKKNNFILIPITEDGIEKVINELTSLYTTFTHDAHLHNFSLIQQKRPFILHGFDKTFINYIIDKRFSTDIVHRITFDFYKEFNIVFQFGSGNSNRNVTIPFTKPAIIYFIITFFSHREGIPQNKSNDEPYSTAIENIYSLINDELKTQGATTRGKGQVYIHNGTMGPSLTRIKQALQDNNIPQPYFVQENNKSYSVISFNEEKIYARTAAHGVFKLFDRYHNWIRTSSNHAILDNYGMYISFFKHIFNRPL